MSSGTPAKRQRGQSSGSPLPAQLQHAQSSGSPRKFEPIKEAHIIYVIKLGIERPGKQKGALGGSFDKHDWRKYAFGYDQTAKKYVVLAIHNPACKTTFDAEGECYKISNFRYYALL